MIEGDDLDLFERTLRHANKTCNGASLDAALADVGWHDALAVDQRAAVAIQFELQGRANTTSSALDDVMSFALGVDGSVAVVLPPLGRSAPPGSRCRDHLAVEGIATAALARRERALAAATADGTSVLKVAPVAELDTVSVRGIDPELGLVLVTGEVAAPDEVAPAHWDAAVDLARVAIGHELTGAARAMLDLARDHALERIQFGQPIAMFQAVRHRLAEALVAIETASAMLDAAWLDRTPQTAAMAKAVAGRSARTTAKHCQQVLAGIGFTLEHPFHRYLRRILVLDELLGSARTLTTSLGAEVLATGRLPRMLAL
jgi:hypothetical protein